MKTGQLALPAPSVADRITELMTDSGRRSGEGDIAEKHRVTLMKDHIIDFPSLWLDIFIVGDSGEEAMFAPMFARANCSKAKNIEDADLVVFTGGPDVDPQLYGETQHPTTHVYQQRDTDDIDAYLICIEKGIPMFGVCRGAQFLSVMNGGKLFQHVDNHTGDHPMWDTVAAVSIAKVSSVHHQMCIENDRMTVLGTSGRSTVHWKNAEENVTGNFPCVEAFFYRDTCCLGVQGHPEYRGYTMFAKWCLDRINDYIVLNTDVDWVGGKRRLGDELKSVRDAAKKPVTITADDEPFLENQ